MISNNNNKEDAYKKIEERWFQFLILFQFQSGTEVEFIFFYVCCIIVIIFIKFSIF